MTDLLARKARDGSSYRALEEETGISRHTIAAWAARLRREAAGDEEKRSAFVELVAVEPTEEATAETAIEIVVGHRVLRVRRGFDAPTLSRVLGVLALPC